MEVISNGSTITMTDSLKTLTKLKDFVNDYLEFAEKFPLGNVLDAVWESYHPTTWLHDLRLAARRIQQITTAKDNSCVDPMAILGCQLNLSIMLLFQAKLLNNGYDDVKKSNLDYVNSYTTLDKQCELLQDKVRYLETRSRHLLNENQSLRDENDNLLNKLLDANDSVKNLKSRENNLVDALHNERLRCKNWMNAHSDNVYRNKRMTQDSFINGLSPRQSWCPETPSDPDDFPNIRERISFPSQSCESLAPPIQSRSSIRSTKIFQDKLHDKSLRSARQSPLTNSPRLSFTPEAPIPGPSTDSLVEKRLSRLVLSSSNREVLQSQIHFTQVMKSFLSDTQQLQTKSYQRHKSLIVPRRVRTLTKVTEGRHASFNSPPIINITELEGIYKNDNNNKDKDTIAPLSSIEHRLKAKLQLTRNQSSNNSNNSTSPSSSLKSPIEYDYQLSFDPMSGTEARAVAEAIQQISSGEFVWKSSRNLLGQEKRSLRFLIVDPQTKTVSWSKRGLNSSPDAISPPGSMNIDPSKDRRLGLRSFTIRAIRVITDPINPEDLQGAVPDGALNGLGINIDHRPSLSIVLEAGSASRAIKFKLMNVTRHEVWELALRHLHLASRTPSSTTLRSPTATSSLGNITKRRSFLFRRSRW